MCYRPWGWNPRFGKVLSVSAISLPHTDVCSLAFELLQRAKPISPITANQACSHLCFLKCPNMSLLLIYPSLFFFFLSTNQEHHIIFPCLTLSDRHGDQRDFSALIVLVYSWLTSWKKKKQGLVHKVSPWCQRSQSFSPGLTDNMRQSQTQIWIRPTWLPSISWCTAGK